MILEVPSNPSQSVILPKTYQKHGDCCLLRDLGFLTLQRAQMHSEQGQLARQQQTGMPLVVENTLMQLFFVHY